MAKETKAEPEGTEEEKSNDNQESKTGTYSCDKGPKQK